MQRILVADDDADCRAVVSDALSDFYVVEEAVDGRDVIQKVEGTPPDLILLDIMMSGQDGLMTLKALKSTAATSGIPVIMLTAMSKDDLTVECLNSGALDYITKPFSNQVLRARVAAVLRKQQVRESASSGGVIAVVGAKGGVGATTLALNVGVALASNRKTTLLAELACGNRSAASLLGISDQSCDLSINRETVAHLQRHLVKHFSGLRFVPLDTCHSVCSEWDVPTTEGFLKHAGRAAQYVIADLPRCAGIATDIVLRAADRVIVVSDTEPLSMTAAQKTLKHLTGNGVQDFNVSVALVNRSPLGHRRGINELKKALGHEDVYVIVHDVDFLARCSADGTPAMCSDAQHVVSASFRELAERIVTRLEPDVASVSA